MECEGGGYNKGRIFLLLFSVPFDEYDIYKLDEEESRKYYF